MYSVVPRSRLCSLSFGPSSRVLLTLGLVSGLACRPDPLAGSEGATESTTEGTTATGTTEGTTAETGSTGSEFAPDCVEFDDLAVVWNDATSIPRVVRGADLRYTAASCEGAVFTELTSPEEAALAVIDALGPLYGLTARDTFALRSTDEDPLGYTHVRLAHTYDADLPVFASELSVHFDADGHAYEVSGHLHPTGDVATEAALTQAQAITAAQAEFKLHFPGETGEATTPALSLHAGAGPAKLAFDLELDSGGTHRRRYLIDAADGAVLLGYNTVRSDKPEGAGSPATITGERLVGEGGAEVELTGWRDDASGHYHLFNEASRWSVNEPQGCERAGSQTPVKRETSAWQADDRFAISVAANVQDTLDYFWSTHQYRGWNNSTQGERAGANHLNVVLRYSCDQPSSYYAGEGTMIIGIGDDSSVDLGPLDIVAHEFAHAIIDETAGLLPRGHAGAIAESFADIFGVAVEFAHQPSNAENYPNTVGGTADWLFGEDSGPALRDLRSPGEGGAPSRYSGTDWADHNDLSEDHGGVHHNAGVQDQFFYLLSEGGAGSNDGNEYNLSGIGVDAAALIAFRALTVYGSPDSDLFDIREAWISAADDLDPIDPQVDWVQEIKLGWDAVNVIPNDCPTWYADGDGDGFGDIFTAKKVCVAPPGYVANGLDCDDSDPARYSGADEVCSDGVVNDCTMVFCADDPEDPECVDAGDYCGELDIAVVDGDIVVSWASDCLLQTSPDLMEWADHDGPVSQDECSRVATFEPAEQFFRLRLPDPVNVYCAGVEGWPAMYTMIEDEVLPLVNAERAAGANCGAKGVYAPTGPVTLHPQLSCPARKHSKDMVENAYFNHQNLQGDQVWHRVEKAGYDYSTVGENIAAGQVTPAEVMQAWMDSDGHCANIMNPDFEHIGIGYYPGGEYMHTWTQVFGADWEP